MAQQLDEKQTSLIKLLDEHSDTRRKLTRLEREQDDDDEPLRDGDENGERTTRCSFTIGTTEEEEEEGDRGLGEPTKTRVEEETIEKEGSLESGEAAKNRVSGKTWWRWWR